MNKTDIYKEIFRLRIKYNSTRRKEILEKSKRVFRRVFVSGVIFGMGWYFWALCGPSATIRERVVMVVIFYTLFGLLFLAGTTPGIGCIPVKFDRRD